MAGKVSGTRERLSCSAPAGHQIRTRNPPLPLVYPFPYFRKISSPAGNFLFIRSQSEKKVGEMASPAPDSSAGEGKERPRFFDAKAKALCWQKADVVPGRHPERWRKDAAGNVVCKRFFNCQGCLCYEYDHVIPFSKGGQSTVENCQILQSRVNRFKSDKEWLDKSELEGFSCDIKFTDKELDIIEMAVFGDVLRPGNQCRCRTVAEMLGQYKPKKPMPACELPYRQS